jgi:hypothetical protein
MSLILRHEFFFLQRRKGRLMQATLNIERLLALKLNNNNLNHLKGIQIHS